MYSYTCPRCGTSFELRKRVTVTRRRCSHCNHEITPHEIDYQEHEARQFELLEKTIASARFSLFLCEVCGEIWPHWQLKTLENRRCRCDQQIGCADVKRCDDWQEELSLEIIKAHLVRNEKPTKDVVLELVTRQLQNRALGISTQWERQLADAAEFKKRKDLHAALGCLPTGGSFLFGVLVWIVSGSFKAGCVALLILFVAGTIVWLCATPQPKKPKP